jgi:hypothetical protein
MPFRKIQMAMKAQHEKTKQTWYYKPMRVLVVLISISMVGFFNADQVWETIRLNSNMSA